MNNKVVVIGAGTMGNGIAHVFLLNNFKVLLIDKEMDYLNKAVTTITGNLDRQIKKQIITPELKEVALANLTIQDNFSSIDNTYDLVIEAIYENKEAKREIYSKLRNEVNFNSIIATNTSSISITELASGFIPEKFIGMHFMNPVPVMELIEIVRGYSTSDETYNIIKDLSIQIGKKPVEVKDYPGFISNRVLLPMINEAIFALYEGVASAQDIDQVMKLGMNHPMGPLTLADFIGLDVCLNIMEVLYDGFNDSKYRPCPLLKKMVLAGKLGRKSKEGFYKY